MVCENGQDTLYTYLPVDPAVKRVIPVLAVKTIPTAILEGGDT